MSFLMSLRKKGYRLTKPRQEILKVLNNHPLTVQEIAQLLKKKKVSVDLVSIYRVLELFVINGLVNEVFFGDDKKRYELKNHNYHHHHLVCSQCHTIEDISLDEDTFTKSIKNKSEFRILSHHLEFFGLCRKCQ